MSRFPSSCVPRFVFLSYALVGSALSPWVMAGIPEPDFTVEQQGLHVVINVPQTRLFLYRDGKLDQTYPVAVGKMLTQTPAGEYTVTAIARNPTWHVPKSIQKEMAAAGKEVLTVVPPGPSNPLGKVFVRFGEPRLGLGIHGTNVPSSVPGFRSHGCVRMKNEDALTFAGKVSISTPVSVIYQPLLLNTDPQGHLWLTVLPDAYKNGRETQRIRQAAKIWAEDNQRKLELSRFDAALKAGSKAAKPVCLSCTQDNPPRPNQLLALNKSPRAAVPVVAPPVTVPVVNETELAEPALRELDQPTPSVESPSEPAVSPLLEAPRQPKPIAPETIGQELTNKPVKNSEGKQKTIPALLRQPKPVQLDTPLL